MSQKPSIPKGTRDFSPDEMVKRNYIFDTIKKVFQRYGYLPIETPAMENLSTLMGKYGDEGDKLIFKILNSGAFWESVVGTPLGDEIEKRRTEVKLLYEKDSLTEDEKIKQYLLLGYNSAIHQFANSRLVSKISEKALRYDLTVPFARYVVQHQNEITFPFKRYHLFGVPTGHKKGVIVSFTSVMQM